MHTKQGLTARMLLTNVTIATMATDQSYGLIKRGAVVVEGDLVSWVGSQNAVPHEFLAHDEHDLDGRLMTPALIDCHTHIVHGGNRAAEFTMRLNGATYAEISRRGGGIFSTVQDTRNAGETELLTASLTRVDALIAEGVSTIEVKSGYGLDVETEMKMLRVARQIEDQRPVRIRTSFLGAHAVPPEYAGRPNEYLENVCLPALEAAAKDGLADAVDGFCEGIAFDTAQIDRVFSKARELGLPVKLHAEQLSLSGGAQLAARHRALSADHLEYATDEDAKALAKPGSVAVLLPGAFYTLHEEQPPPVQAFRDHAVPMALATDCNPGSSPLTSLLLAMNMGCTLFRLTPQEALAAVTHNAAKALGLADSGKIKPGMRADLAVWDVSHPDELAYRIGFNPLYMRIFGGQF